MVGYINHKGTEAMRKYVGNFVKLGLPALLLVATEVASANGNVRVDSGNNVTSFYGVPVDLTISGLKKLPFPKKRGLDNGEGSREPIYTITAKNRVQIKVKFDGDKLYLAETDSRNAVGPRNIGIGSQLSDVKAAWPMGKFIYGAEDGGFATYVTGTNVLYLFDPRDLPPKAFAVPRQEVEIPNLRVQKIRILAQPNPVP